MVYLEIDDDHYIANAKNAHIDTSEFEKEILAEVTNNTGIEDEALVELIYEKAFSKTAVAPVEPGDNVLGLFRFYRLTSTTYFEMRTKSGLLSNHMAPRWNQYPSRRSSIFLE